MSVKSLLFISLLILIQNTNAQETNEAVQFIDHPDKNEYLLHKPGSDKHKYGYELRENKHFHHTTTEDDGVRLGCYGYVLNGKKYSTQYVADIKGYRPVFTYDTINVYPKSGDVREASFIGNFNEDESKSSNIRYFFPEGCKGGDEVSPEENEMPPPVPLQKATPKPSSVTPTKLTASTNTNTKPFVRVPEKPSPSPSPTPFSPPPSTKPKSPPPSPPAKSAPIDKYLPPIASTYLPPIASTYLPPIASTYLPPVTATATATATATSSIPGKYITKTLTTAKPPVTKPPTKAPIVQTSSVNSKPVSSNCEINGNCESQTIKIKNPTDTCNQCCFENDSSPTVTIPIKLSSNGKSDSCSSYAKLIIPAGSISQEKLKSLLNSPTELTRDILKSLS